jgi:hypothetical protein
MISPGNLEVDIQEFIASNPQCEIYEKIYWYNPRVKKYQTPSKLEPMKGYWLYARKDCTAILSGISKLSSSLILQPGWNLISSLKTVIYPKKKKEKI